MFLVKSWCRGLSGGKEVSSKERNSFPTLLFTFREKGGLNHVTGLLLVFFFFAASWIGVYSRPGNNSQLSCSLARKSENFCGKYVIYAEKIKNIRRKFIEINSFYRNSKKSIEKLDGSQHSQNIFDKPREIFQIISASLNNFLQLDC